MIEKGLRDTKGERMREVARKRCERSGKTEEGEFRKMEAGGTARVIRGSDQVTVSSVWGREPADATER